MTSPLAAVIARSGILDAESLDEFRKWGAPLDELLEPESLGFKDAKELVLSIEEALQSVELVLEKVTDLEVLRKFLHTQKLGILHVHIGGETAEFDVLYGRNGFGEYIMPWKGESMAEELANGLTHLLLPETGEQVFFQNVRDLYFGDHRAFVACTPTGNLVSHVRPE